MALIVVSETAPRKLADGLICRIIKRVTGDNDISVEETVWRIFIFSEMTTTYG